MTARVTNIGTGLAVGLPPEAAKLGQRVLEAGKHAAGRGARAWSVVLAGVLYVRVDGGAVEDAARAAKEVLRDAGVLVEEL